MKKIEKCVRKNVGDCVCEINWRLHVQLNQNRGLFINISLGFINHKKLNLFFLKKVHISSQFQILFLFFQNYTYKKLKTGISPHKNSLNRKDDHMLAFARARTHMYTISRIEISKVHSGYIDHMLSTTSLEERQQRVKAASINE